MRINYFVSAAIALAKIRMANQVASNDRSREALTNRAKRVRSALFTYGRYLLSVDDATVELPLRQLKLCLRLADGEQSMSAIGQELELSRSAMTQIVLRLERKGLVEREMGSVDKRARMLKLTARGRRLMQVHENQQVKQVAKVLRSIPVADLQKIDYSFQVLVSACEGMGNLCK